MGDNVGADEIKAFVERVENLEAEKKALSEDIKEVYLEAKGRGFDAPVLRRIVAIRKMDAAKRKEFEAVLDLYMSALGME